MGHAYHHAESSARKFGGSAQDYLALHAWFDATKSHLALPSHRALRHHAEGIFALEGEFGVVVTNSAGREVPVRFVGEQHVREDCRCIPTIADWLRHLPMEPWMVNGIMLPDQELDVDTIGVTAWRHAVSERQTVLGYGDWAAQHRERAREAHVQATRHQGLDRLYCDQRSLP